MKNNEKVMPYIPTFELYLRKSTHPACKILKPLVPYRDAEWVQDAFYGTFSLFPNPSTTLTIKELK